MQVGPRTIGMLGLVREQVDAFSAEELELIALLGRLVATAVQNIRAYEAERSTADELRRLSALRADFVSLVSHELRSPMAAVIGAARTLQGRSRELTPEQRDAFLALISDETSRLAAPAGGEVHVSAIAGDGLVRVEVRDQGPGIPLDDQKLIFEKFGRSNVSGAAKPGTGLGLFIARSIAEAHGGSLDVDSAPERGSTF